MYTTTDTGLSAKLPEIEDYTGAEDDKVVPVQVARVGLKTPTGGGTIYEQPAD
jgi:hypothetical protein